MKLLDNILAKWRLVDPLFHRIASTHLFEPNKTIACPVRTGKGRVEYNEDLIKRLSDTEVERLLKIEMIRIALHHPYERRPDFCSGTLMTLASNLVIADNYPEFADMLPGPLQYGLPVGKNYEWYALKLYSLMDEDGPGPDPALEDVSELWDEDDESAFLVVMTSEGVESLYNEPGREVLRIEKEPAVANHVIARLRSIIHSSCCSDERRFTRMRPNRRRDYEVMGMVRKENPRILIAFDVSGSMYESARNRSLGIVASIGRAFKTSADVLFFDTDVRCVVPVRKAMGDVLIPGGGDTDFQHAVDYAVKNRYDVLVFLTDGECDPPQIPPFFTSRVLWCSMNKRKEFMSPKSYLRI